MKIALTVIVVLILLVTAIGSGLLTVRNFKEFTNPDRSEVELRMAEYFTNTELPKSTWIAMFTLSLAVTILSIMGIIGALLKKHTYGTVIAIIGLIIAPLMIYFEPNISGWLHEGTSNPKKLAVFAGFVGIIGFILLCILKAWASKAQMQSTFGGERQS
jgi:uncharacterized membrane protein